MDNIINSIQQFSTDIKFQIRIQDTVSSYTYYIFKEMVPFKAQTVASHISF